MWAAIASIVGAIITGVIAVVNNNENVSSQKEINEKNIAYQENANQQNIQNSWDMWNATNEYNTPANQMERYKDAGLNPNLIYGQSNTASSVSIPSMQSPQLTAPKHDLSGLIRAFDKLVDVPFVKEQYEILKEQVKQAKSETNIKDTEKHIIDREFDVKDAEAAEAIVRKGQVATILGNYDEYLKAYYQGLIDTANSPSEKIKLMKSQAKVHDAMSNLREIEKKYVDSDGENIGYYELRNEAMKIANQIKDIDLDWKEFEKELGASSGITKLILQMIKTFIR